MKEIIINSIKTGVYLQRYPAVLATEPELTAFEKRLGQGLPPDYRSFLLAYNGGVCEPKNTIPVIGGYLAQLYCAKPDGTQGCLPLRPPQDCRRQWPALPEETLPIGEVDNGDLIVILFGGRRSEIAILHHEKTGFSLTIGTRDFTSFLVQTVREDDQA